MIVDGEKLKEKIREHKNELGLTSKDGLDECIAAQLEWCVNALESCKLPIQPQARIEAAIRELEGPENPLWGKVTKALEKWEQANPPKDATRQAIEADLLRWVLGQPQETWKDKDFGLEEETNERT